MLPLFDGSSLAVSYRGRGRTVPSSLHPRNYFTLPCSVLDSCLTQEPQHTHLLHISTYLEEERLDGKIDFYIYGYLTHLRGLHKAV